MIRFAADEDFNSDVVRALRRALPEVNILGVAVAASPIRRFSLGQRRKRAFFSRMTLPP